MDLRVPAPALSAGAMARITIGAATHMRGNAYVVARLITQVEIASRNVQRLDNFPSTKVPWNLH